MKRQIVIKACNAILIALAIAAMAIALIGALRPKNYIETPTMDAAQTAATSEPIGGWNQIAVPVSNTINDFAFDVTGYYQFNRINNRFECRVYVEEINSRLHYLQIDGYEFESFAGWKISSDGQYYAQAFAVIDGARMVANYTAKAYTVTFIDSRSGEQIGAYTASYGGAVKPPAAADYLTEGYIFVGWDGGSYEGITRDTTLYAVYAPARYITAIMPDGTKEKIAVAAGSKLSEAIAPKLDGKSFKEWKNEDGQTVSGEMVIDYDLTLSAIYDGGGLPSWAVTTLIVAGSVIGAILVLWIAVKIFVKVRK